MPATPTPEEFLEEFPEFSGAPADLVLAKLKTAARRTNATTWGDLWATGVKYRAADLLAKSPFGRKMRMVEKGTTSYAEDLKSMMRRVAAGRARVTS